MRYERGFCVLRDFIYIRHIYASRLPFREKKYMVSKMTRSIEGSSSPSSGTLGVRCPDCKSIHIVKCGKRKTKRGSRQQYHCNECGKRFVYNPFPGKMYRPGVIVDSIKLYYSGHPLSRTSKMINSRYKVNTSESTIYNWITEFDSICSYSSRREHRGKYGSPLIKRNPFYHDGLRYEFRYHVGKLGDERRYHEKVVEFTRSVSERCPNELFNDDSSNTKRASELDLDISGDLDLYRTRNNACQLAGLALRANRNRKKRHTEVEEFMLTCDNATVAAELPVWYYDKDLECSVTGHIDLVQLRSGKVFLLDYKPKAQKKNPVTQLYTYCKAFSYRTETPLEMIRAAWFDEEIYIELKPLQFDI